MAFSESSRYVLVATTSVVVDGGRSVTALKLRILPRPDAVDRVVAAHERLDHLAYELTQDGTRFWHIADANDTLDATTLGVPGAIIRVPRQP